MPTRPARNFGIIQALSWNDVFHALERQDYLLAILSAHRILEDSLIGMGVHRRGVPLPVAFRALRKTSDYPCWNELLKAVAYRNGVAHVTIVAQGADVGWAVEQIYDFCFHLRKEHGLAGSVVERWSSPLRGGISHEPLPDYPGWLQAADSAEIEEHDSDETINVYTQVCDWCGGVPWYEKVAKHEEFRGMWLCLDCVKEWRAGSRSEE